MEQIEQLLYLTTKQFSLTEEEAKTLLLNEEGTLKDNAADLILEKDRERIAAHKVKQTEQHDEGFKKAEKKYKGHSEETFKKITGYSGDEDNFEAMFKTWYEAEKKKLVTKSALTEDDIKKHPLYIALETDRIPKKDYDELKTSFDEFKTSKQKDQVMGVVTGRAWGLVSAKNPILSENPSVADNRRLDFLSKFHRYEYDLTDDKIIVSEGGKRLEDPHGNPKSFESFVSDLAALNFDFKAQDDKGNAGNKTGGGGAVIITETPTTDKELYIALDKYGGAGDDDAKKRIAILKYYNEHKKD